jgi:hypothetical protein
MRIPEPKLDMRATPPKSGGNVVSDALAQAEHAVVFDHAVETEPRSDGFKEIVVRVRHGLRQVHVMAALHFDHGVTIDDAFGKSSQRDERLDGGARLKAG